MNKSKACFIVTMLFFVAFCISGCNSSSKFEFSQSYDYISKIEVIEITDKHENVLAELSSDSEIISDIKNLQCKKYWNDPNQTITGLALKVYYTDTSYEIITWESNAYYSKNSCDYGWEYFNKESFESLLNSYVENE